MNDWNALRAGVITASDVAALVGASKYVTPWQLHQRKAGLLPPVDESEAMAWGTLHETAIFARLTQLCPSSVLWRRMTDAVGVPAAPGVEVLHTERGPFHLDRTRCLGCTMDGFGVLQHPDAAGQHFGVEAKTVGADTHRGWVERYTEPPLPGLPGATRELPDGYVLQAQTQMLLSGLPWTLVPVLVGGNRLECHRVDADPVVGAALAQLASEAMAAVHEGLEPPFNPFRDAEALALVVPRRAALTEAVDASGDLAAWLHEAAALRAVVRRLEARADELQALAFKACADGGIRSVTSPLVSAAVVTLAERPERVVVQAARPASAYLRITPRKGAAEELLAGLTLPALTTGGQK